MAKGLLVLRIISLIWMLDVFSTPDVAAKAVTSMAKPGCPESCPNNNIIIPYPFGIGKDCYHNSWFEITCNRSTSKPVLNKLKMEVLNISIGFFSYTSYVVLNSPIFSTCKHGNFWRSTDLRGSPFEFDTDRNRFTVLGCNNILLQNQSDAIIAGCTSTCNADLRSIGTGCYGINCCQTIISSVSLSSYHLNASMTSKTNNATNNNCVNDTKGFLLAYAYDHGVSLGNIPDVSFMNQLDEAPVLLSWTLLSEVFSAKDAAANIYLEKGGYVCDSVFFNSGWTCGCTIPYEGNPYFQGGCTVVHEECADCKDSCATHDNNKYFCRKSNKTTILEGSAVGGGGVFYLLLVAFVFSLVKEIRRRREIKRRKKFFKRNGGFLLQQETSYTKDSVERTKIFKATEIEKATDGYNTNRILGQGGQGTVYKGMLTDGKIVAVKRSKIIDDSQVKQFINEVVILSQINQRNIVKLLGCCLETEVPLLVYEFISNGSLFQLIHNQDEDFPLSWEMRLRIATEVAGALAYLHSSSSSPVYHRDIKSSNILLDEKFRAKIADFGTSRTIAIEQTHLTTLVMGTFGYLDPEYFRSSQFTDKSDVYSFGVVLAELLTGLKPILSTKGHENLNLSAYFTASAEDGCLENILDSQVRKHGRKDDILAFANLARRCLSLTGRERPTMREITVELEGIRMSRVPSACLDNAQSVTEVKEPICVDSSLTLGSSYYDEEGSSYDSYLLMYNR